MSVKEYAETLADYRVRNIRASDEVVEKGSYILEHNGISKLGSEAWAFLEQLALAAMDVGNMDIADDVLAQLEDKFPESPRVQCLHGIRLETTGDLSGALKAYDDILDKDETDAAIWKRKVSVLRQLGDTRHALEELLKYLDTFYGDVEGWLEAADIYASCNLYPQSLSSLSHVLLLAPQNPFYVLQVAETAYTAGDISLAAKMYLRTVEMADESSATRRAWLGLKQCVRRLTANPNIPSASETEPPKHLDLLDQLATEKLLDGYSSSKTKVVPGHLRETVIRWVQK